LNSIGFIWSAEGERRGGNRGRKKKILDEENAEKSENIDYSTNSSNHSSVVL